MRKPDNCPAFLVTKKMYERKWTVTPDFGIVTLAN